MIAGFVQHQVCGVQRTEVLATMVEEFELANFPFDIQRTCSAQVLYLLHAEQMHNTPVAYPPSPLPPSSLLRQPLPPHTPTSAHDGAQL